MNAAAVPSLLTCEQNHDYPRLHGYGYRVMWFQHWNRGVRGPLDTGGDYDFTSCRAGGMAPGVWAVIYQDEDPRKGDIAAQAANRALELTAEHLMFDIEYVTGSQQDWSAVVDGCRRVGWSKEVHLTCLGAPEYSPAGGFWDYGYDTSSFTGTGGGVFPQAYYGISSGRDENYAPKVCVDYYHGQLGVPVDQLNLMVWPNGSNPPELELALLEEAEMGPQMSVFLAETTSQEMYEALRPCSQAPPLQPPEPEPEPEPEPPMGTVIGSQHGVVAEYNALRDLDPTKTLLKKVGGKWEDLSTLNSVPLSSWKAWDKAQRTKTILVNDHDQALQRQQNIPGTSTPEYAAMQRRVQESYELGCPFDPDPRTRGGQP